MNNMNDVIGWVFAVWLAITTAVTINVMITDYRNFDNVVKACQTTGYIQDTKTRVYCGVEKPTDRN